jgi:hypothetical protein
LEFGAAALGCGAVDRERRGIDDDAVKLGRFRAIFQHAGQNIFSELDDF